ncbi:MAG: hypothetical protein ACTHK8_10990 [Ginsengibacter sp.]
MRRIILPFGILVFISSCQPKLPTEVQLTVDTINVLSNKLYVLDSIIDKTDPRHLSPEQVDNFLRITLSDYGVSKELASKNEALMEMIHNEPRLIDYDEVRNCGEKRYPIKDRFEIQEKINNAMQMSLDNHTGEAEK